MKRKLACYYATYIRDYFHICVRLMECEINEIVVKSGSHNLLEPSGSVQACNGIGLQFSVVNVNSYFLNFIIILNRAIFIYYTLMYQQNCT